MDTQSNDEPDDDNESEDSESAGDSSSSQDTDPNDVRVSDQTVTQDGRVGSDTDDDASSEREANRVLEQGPLPQVDSQSDQGEQSDEQTPVLRAPQPTDQPFEDDRGRREPPEHGLEDEETRQRSEGEGQGQEEESPGAP